MICKINKVSRPPAGRNIWFTRFDEAGEDQIWLRFGDNYETAKGKGRREH